MQTNGSTVKLQFSGLGWSAAKCPLFWSCPLFLDLFMYSVFKVVTEKSLAKWRYLLFLEFAKLEFHCTRLHHCCQVIVIHKGTRLACI